jgi:hypothetical protein
LKRAHGSNCANGSLSGWFVGAFVGWTRVHSNACDTSAGEKCA